MLLPFAYNRDSLFKIFLLVVYHCPGRQLGQWFGRVQFTISDRKDSDQYRRHLLTEHGLCWAAPFLLYWIHDLSLFGQPLTKNETSVRVNNYLCFQFATEQFSCHQKYIILSPESEPPSIFYQLHNLQIEHLACRFLCRLLFWRIWN